MEKHTCKTYFSFICETEDVIKDIAEELGATFLRRGNRLITGLNENYDVDVNAMLRITLKDLFGKEDKIKALAGRFKMTSSLVIVPYLVSGSEQPNPYLSLESDIIAFLYKSGTAMDLDYYVI